MEIPVTSDKVLILARSLISYSNKREMHHRRKHNRSNTFKNYTADIEQISMPHGQNDEAF
jgi:hypothetical protein